MQSRSRETIDKQWSVCTRPFTQCARLQYMYTPTVGAHLRSLCMRALPHFGLGILAISAVTTFRTGRFAHFAHVSRMFRVHRIGCFHISNPPTIPYPTRCSTDPTKAQSVEGWCSLVWAKIHRLLAARTPFSNGERPIAAGQCFITYSLRALASSWSIPLVGFRTGCRNVRS